MIHNRILFLLSIFVLLSACYGCSDQYALERMMWRADQAARPILSNEGGAVPFELKRVAGLYEKIIARAPDSEYAVNARFRITALLVSQQQYADARMVLRDIEQSCAGKPEIQAMALFETARTHEKEGNWEQALKIFQDVLTKYARTNQSLQVPLYIARYYVKSEDAANAGISYQAAIVYLESIAEQYPNTKAAVSAENLVLRAYLEQEDWPGALACIQRLDAKYKLGPDTLGLLAKIYAEKMHDNVKAIAAYERILKDFPDSKGLDLIKKNIENLKGNK